jgi:hypothetical protein
MRTAGIAAALYEPEPRVLEVKFIDGVRRRYYNVPDYVYRAMRASKTQGVFYDQFIRGNFLSRPVAEQKALKAAS